MNLVRKAKAGKVTIFHDGFSTNLVHKTEFLNLGFCSIFFKFWHSVSFVKGYSVLVGRHTIFQGLSLNVIFVRSVHLGYTVLKSMPNIKITTKRAHTDLCAYYSILNIWDAKNVLIKLQFNFLVFHGVYISLLTRYKQGTFPINNLYFHNQQLFGSWLKIWDT